MPNDPTPRDPEPDQELPPRTPPSPDRPPRPEHPIVEPDRPTPKPGKPTPEPRRSLGTIVGLMLLLSTPAWANTITVTPTPIIAGGGPYTWNYAVSLEGQSQINPGDFFTIFDFAGLVPGTQNAPAGWTPSSTLTGVCPAQAPFPALCAVADDPAVPNLTWTRTGGVIVGPGAGASVVLGQFVAQSLYNLPRNDFFVSQDQDNQLVPPSPNEAAGGNTNVPTAAVPEPATLLLLGTGLLFVVRRVHTRRLVG